VATGKALAGFGKHDGGLNGLALAPDDRSMAVVTMGGSLFLWERATQQPRLIVKDAGYATAVAFSPDGRWLALANAGNHSLLTQGKVVKTGIENREEVRLVRVADGKVIRRFTGHAGGIDCLHFSPDGRTLASGGLDTTVLLWDVAGLRASTPKDVPLRNEELTAAWEGLRAEAAEAHRRMAALTASPTQAVRLLRDRLQPIAAVAPDHLARLLQKLDSNQFGEREEATRELKKIGDAAEPALRQALQGNLPLETRRRVEIILGELGGADGASGERLRFLRAIEVLERIANSEARDLLRQLAGGASGAWLTEEARGALRRLPPP
jgi:hypothetical protein